MLKSELNCKNADLCICLGILILNNILYCFENIKFFYY